MTSEGQGDLTHNAVGPGGRRLRRIRRTPALAVLFAPNPKSKIEKPKSRSVTADHTRRDGTDGSVVSEPRL
jgi:hypothetical protein